MGQVDLLIDYVKAQRGKPFALGEHDCFTFTNGAWRTMHGHGYADKFIGRYAGLGKKAFAKLMRECFNTSDLIKALDAGLHRVETFPPKGALVATKNARPYFTGYALGLAMGVNAVFLGEDDMIYLPISEIEGAWV
jgi:hypothetical protein